MAMGATGVWAHQLRHYPTGPNGGPGTDAGLIADAAAELESLGYSAVWIGDVGGELFEALDVLLDATTTMTVASGVLNVWRHDAADSARGWLKHAPEQRQRLMLGLGISHAPLIGDAYRRPLAVMGEYLDGLDTAGLPREARCIAALGPKMLELARTRSAGSHPYLVPPEHTALARESLGPDALLAPEVGVVLETDPDTARSVARQAIGLYTSLPNYTRNWQRFGFDDHDVTTLSDRLLDRLVAWGDADTIAARIDEHRQAGADHVCIQVLADFSSPMPRDVWRALAPALIPAS